MSGVIQRRAEIVRATTQGADDLAIDFDMFGDPSVGDAHGDSF